MRPPHPYQNLSPDCVLNAIESVGYVCDGHLLGLNSYENRVYRVGILDAPPLVAKFYRPERWTNEAILEEHHFTFELAEREIPVVAPIRHEASGQSLYEFEGFRFALYPCRPGRAPELDVGTNLKWLGRFLGRIHALGAVEKYKHRRTLTIKNLGEDSLAFLFEHDFLPQDLKAAYQSIVTDIMQLIKECFAQAGNFSLLRIHGDCHPGNIMWTEAGPHFVDFDDSCMGPAIQDIWMLLSGDRAQMSIQLDSILSGYREFFSFNSRELHLIEALRSLRMIHYSAWLARRWDDPAFPLNFPWFNTQHYWQDQILALREQIALMQEPPLELPW